MAETNTIGNSLSQVTRVGSLLLGEVRGGVAQHLHQDAFNSVMVTSLADGTIPGRLSYRAFGQVRSLTGNVPTPFRFNGYVSDGGDELSSPSRFYSMGTGRFTSMDPVAPTQMDPLSWNAHLGLGANPMFFIDPDGRREFSTRATLVMSQWNASPEHRAIIDQQLALMSANQVPLTRAEKYLIGGTTGAGRIAVGAVVGTVELAKVGAKTWIAQQSHGAIFGEQVRQNDETAAVIGTFLVNHPYDQTVNAASNEMSEIAALDAAGDYVGAADRFTYGAGNTALVATGAFGLVRGGARMVGGGIAQRAEIAAAQDAAFMAKIDADFARATRGAEGKPVVVVEDAASVGNKTQSSVPLVVGENMEKRVIPHAERHGYEYFKPTNYPRDMVDTQLENFLVIQKAKSENRVIIDIGPDLIRRKREGVIRDAYEMESWQLRNYKNRVEQKFIPTVLE